MTSPDIIKRIANAFGKFFRRDAELLDLGADGINEQTLTFRLGLYLASEFHDHDVDCEYNRLWDAKKCCLRFGISWMKPDVIVHIRQSADANLLCVEAKKISNWKKLEETPQDVVQKLTALTHPEEQYRYLLGLAWRIAPSDDARDHDAIWFVNGVPVLTTQLAEFEEPLEHKLTELGIQTLRA